MSQFTLVLVILFSLSAWASLKELMQTESVRNRGVIEFVESQNTYGLVVYRSDYLLDKLEINFESGFLENRFFKIVNSTTDNAVQTNDFDGRNVFLHLNKARAFFESIDQEVTKIRQQSIVRVHVSNKYAYTRHFFKSHEYNQSGYFCADYAGRWGTEIWFHQSKASLDWKRALLSTGVAATGGVAALTISVPISLISNHDIGIDSAKVPSVIYHEAFHWATDKLDLFEAGPYRNPLAEDLADYFAASILGRPFIAEISEFASKSYRRNFQKITVPKISKKLKRYNYFAFIPSLLWSIRNLMPIDELDRVLWQSIRELKMKTSYKEYFEIVARKLLESNYLTASRVIENYSANIVLLDQTYEAENPLLSKSVVLDK